MFEKFLFRKVEVWAVLLIVVLGIFGTLLFGMAVRDLGEGKDRFGPLSPAVRNIVSAHATLSQLVKDIRFPGRALRAQGDALPGGRSGFEYTYPPGSAPDAPYVLINRFDRDMLKSVSELVDLNSQEMVHQWVFDMDPVWRESHLQDPSVNLQADAATSRFRGTHVLPDDDGNIVFQGMGTPLVKFDLCGTLVWQEDTHVFHHSLERDADGNYWGPAHLVPKTVDLGKDFYDDGVVQVSPEGELLFARSVVGILDKNGLTHLIYGSGPSQQDPIHLNDVQPVLEDGAIWKRGDLAISVRNRSLLVVYRPSTDEVIWHQAGPWLHQHDVDILDDRHLSVFDNHARLISPDNPACPIWSTDACVKTAGVNRRMVINVVTGETESTFVEGFEANNIRTDKQGLLTLMPDGNLFVEETNRGRLLEFDAAGNMIWNYVNRAEADGSLYTLNWSRIVPRTTGDAIRSELSKGVCNG